MTNHDSTVFRLVRLISILLILLSGSAFAEEAELVVAVEKSGDGFIVSAKASAAAPLRTVWAVLTDFDHMANILNNLNVSTILQRKGNTLRVLQQGRAWYGPFFYSFSSEREVRLEPMRRIVSRQITGTTQHFESRMELSADGDNTFLRYHAEIVPGSTLARTFGSAFIQHEVEEQLNAMLTEISRKKTL